MLVLSPLAIFAFFYFRRYETGDDSPYDKTIQRFRIALLIIGIGGLLGLLRLWLTIRNN